MKSLIQQNNKKILSSVLFSVLLSFAMTLGSAMYMTNDIAALVVNLPTAIHYLLLFLAMVVLFSIATYFLFSVEPKNYSLTLAKEKPFLTYLILVVFFILCWMPAYLSYYPGIWSYDMNVQIYEASSWDYSMHHPPLHTFLLYLFMALTNWNFPLSIALYGIFQMIFLSCIFALAIMTMIKHDCPLAITIISVLFYALNPVLAIFSFIPVKDMMCCGFLTLLILELISLLAFPTAYLSKSSNFIRFTIYALLFCLFRNNAVYAFILLIPFAILFFKKYWKKILILFGLPTILYFSVILFLFPSMGIKQTESVESLSVPLQQIANTVVYADDISERDLDTIDQFLPIGEIEDAYNPRFADPIKDGIYNGVNGPIYVIKEWLHLLPSHVKEYINGFLALHIPYWYPAANALDPYSKALYIDTNVTVHGVDAPFTNAGILPSLLAFYEKIATYSAFKDLPQFLNIFTLSFPLWFLIFSLFRLIARGEGKEALIVLLPLLFFLTYLLGPVSNLRYIVPVIAQLPIALFVITSSPCTTGEATLSTLPKCHNQED